MIVHASRFSMRVVLFAVAAWIAAWSCAAAAQPPHRTVIILPFAKGGPSDVLMRQVAPLLSAALDREVTIENIIDPQGDRLNDLAANLRRDGSVLLALPFSASARRLQAGDSQFTPIGILLDTPLSIVVHESLGEHNLSTLTTAPASLNRKLRIAVSATGGPSEMCGRQIAANLGANSAQLVTVPNEAGAVAAIANGQVDLICTNAANHRSGGTPKLREIAEVRFSTSANARPAPVPVAAVTGFNIVAPNWLGLYAPTGTDAAMVGQISSAIVRLQNDPKFIDLISRMHAVPVAPEQATADGLLQSLKRAISLQK
jgi:tripartite-type tricarboxylate transporter receptor subunit TctC